MSKRINRILRLTAVSMLTFSLLLTGCGTNQDTTGADTKETEQAQATTEAVTEGEKNDAETQDKAESKETADTKKVSTTASYIIEATDAPEISGLTCEGKMQLDYANCFAVYYYQDGYKLIDVFDSAQYLLVPEGKEAPAGLSADITVIKQPLDKIYMAATSAMALFRGLDGLDTIRMTGTDASGWYVQEAAEALENGTMLFAGKYSEPDYEMLVDEGCDLAIESTMILHSPKVQEMIEALDIPVFMDRSSYETHPLGRTEWIKLYGAMLNKEETAFTFFAEQSQVITELKDFENTEKTVAFFYINTDGSVVVRKSDDYIPSMIEIAGGRYIFPDLKNEESTSASVPLTMEEFYATAVDADYLIYNGTIDNPISSVQELVAKSSLFEDFKAVKEGNVWTIGKDLYQATDTVGKMITDVHLMLTGGDAGAMTFMTKVD